MLQYFETISEHGTELAREALRKNPAKLITLINACCNSANTSIEIIKQKSRI